MSRKFLAAGLALMVTGAAQAQTYARDHYGGSQGWSVDSAQTVGFGETVVHLEGGWPGIPITVLHGFGNSVDFGARFTFNYAYEGLVNDVFPGLKLQGIARFKLLDTGSVKFGMTLEPGFLVYFPNSNNTLYGMALPVDFVLGFPVMSNFIANAAIGFPMWVTFNNNGTFNFPISFGGGFEYFITSHVAITFNLRLGPVITTTSPTHNAFAMQKALFGVAFRL